MIPGKELDLSGKKLIIAPLTAAACKQYRDEINAVKLGTIPDIDLVAKLALVSLRRNYPEMTSDDVDEILDFGNFLSVWDALMNLSGMVAQVGELVRNMQENMGMKV